MARITCEPCVIVTEVCDCCHELLCFCSKNKVEQCDDPCFTTTQEHLPGGAPLPYFIEGMVPDVNFDISDDDHVVVGPSGRDIIREVGRVPFSIGGIAGSVRSATSLWDIRYNLFSYDFLTDASTHLSAPGMYTDDLSACEEKSDVLVPATPITPNENLKSEINILVNELLVRAGTNTYIPSGVSGGPLGIYGADPQVKTPYNEQLFYLLRNSSFFEEALSDKLNNFLNLVNHKTVSTYNFRQKYVQAIAKSILFGYFEKYFPNGKIDLIEEFSRNSYRNKAVPELNVVSAALSESGPGTASSINLENAKTYITENRIRFNTQGISQRLSNKVLRQYWKFVPSDIDLRVRVYRSLASRYNFYGFGGELYDGSGHTIAGSSLSLGAQAWSIKVNDDDTITVHQKDGNQARTHYINAEHLRVWNNSGGHIYENPINTYPWGGHGWLDPTPRYQTGCGCCTSGCFMSLCSDRDKSYVFDTMDRSVLLGLLGAVSGFTVSSFDPEPYIELTVSAPFTPSSPYGYQGTPEFKKGIAPCGVGNPNSDTARYGGSAIPDYYLLTPRLKPWHQFRIGAPGYSLAVTPSGTDILSGIVDPSNPYVKTTSLEYRIEAIQCPSVREPSFGACTALRRATDRALRYIAGPGNVCYISNDDPFLYYLNYIWDWRSPTSELSVSAKIPDLNIDNILGEGERYPRRIPYHIIIIPSDQPSKNPFFGKSKLLKMEESGVGPPGHSYGSVVRRIKFLPAPTRKELDSNYLDLCSITVDAPTHPFTGMGADYFPLGPQGTTTNPKKMKLNINYSVICSSWAPPLGLTSTTCLTSATTQSVFDVWEHGEERSRRIDPIRKVFDLLSDVSTYYDTRTAITGPVSANLPTCPVQIDNEFDNPYVYEPVYYVSGLQSLPLFDVWRSLDMFEFHEFITSFDNEIFENLRSGKLRGLQLFNVPIKWPEKTFLHKYVEGSPTWDVSSNKETLGIVPLSSILNDYKGTVDNRRNASGVDFIEARTLMDETEERTC